jgi:hypothetical protein
MALLVGIASLNIVENNNISPHFLEELRCGKYNLRPRVRGRRGPADQVERWPVERLIPLRE